MESATLAAFRETCHRAELTIRLLVGLFPECGIAEKRARFINSVQVASSNSLSLLLFVIVQPTGKPSDDTSKMNEVIPLTFLLSAPGG